MIGIEQWYKINDIVKRMFRAEDLGSLQQLFLEGVSSLVPNDQALFYMIRESRGRLLLGSSCMTGVEPPFAREYEQSRFENDLMSDARIPITIVRHLRRPFEPLIPEGMEQGVRILAGGPRRAAAEVTVFRAKAGGDFTDNEMEILNVLGEHLEACLKRDPLYANEREHNHELKLRQDLRNMALTETEIEIALLASEGLSIRQISERRRIAPATVKKHLGRIYGKFGVVGIGQLQYEVCRMLREM